MFCIVYSCQIGSLTKWRDFRCCMLQWTGKACFTTWKGVHRSPISTPWSQQVDLLTQQNDLSWQTIPTITRQENSFYQDMTWWHRSIVSLTCCDDKSTYCYNKSTSRYNTSTCHHSKSFRHKSTYCYNKSTCWYNKSTYCYNTSTCHHCKSFRHVMSTCCNNKSTCDESHQEKSSL